MLRAVGRFVSGNNAPDNILFRVEPIDDRLPSLEDGPSWPLLISNYSIGGADSLFFYLKKTSVPVSVHTPIEIYSGWHALGSEVPVPVTNEGVIAEIDVPEGSFACDFGEGAVWLTSTTKNLVTRVDPKTNKVTDTIPVGPQPRFMTIGSGSIWTLNQGDGSISRVDMKSGKVVATIACGIPGSGGEITFGAGSVWATMFDFPLTQVDAATDKVVKQWAGQGGDGMRFGFGSVWLSNLRQGNVWRLSPDQK